MSDSGWQVLDFSDFKASISGSVRVEPQLGIGLFSVLPKYIKGFESLTPATPVILAIVQSQDPVYQGLKNKNPANNQTSTGTSNLNLDKQTYQ